MDACLVRDSDDRAFLADTWFAENANLTAWKKCTGAPAHAGPCR